MNFYKYINSEKILYNAYLYLLKNNKGLHNPYHNNIHILDVTKTCYDLATKAKINNENIKTLILAALFHDFNHCGDKSVTDDINIKEAIKELKLFYSLQTTSSDHYLGLIIILIESTEFPHKDLSNNPLLNELVNIIRDADMSQVLKTNWIEMTIYGLSKEWGTSLKTQLENQCKFVNTLQFHSEELQLELEKKKPYIIDVCKTLLKKDN